MGDLRKWASEVQHVTLPNGLRDIRAADVAHVPLDLGSLCLQGRSLVESVIIDLRRRIEEANGCRIQRGMCGRKAQEVVLSLQPGEFDEAEEHAIATLGVGV